MSEPGSGERAPPTGFPSYSTLTSSSAASIRISNWRAVPPLGLDRPRRFSPDQPALDLQRDLPLRREPRGSAVLGAIDVPGYFQERPRGEIARGERSLRPLDRLDGQGLARAGRGDGRDLRGVRAEHEPNPRGRALGDRPFQPAAHHAPLGRQHDRDQPHADAVRQTALDPDLEPPGLRGPDRQLAVPLAGRGHDLPGQPDRHPLRRVARGADPKLGRQVREVFQHFPADLERLHHRAPGFRLRSRRGAEGVVERALEDHEVGLGQPLADRVQIGGRVREEVDRRIGLRDAGGRGARIVEPRREGDAPAGQQVGESGQRGNFREVRGSERCSPPGARSCGNGCRRAADPWPRNRIDLHSIPRPQTPPPRRPCSQPGGLRRDESQDHTQRRGGAEWERRERGFSPISLRVSAPLRDTLRTIDFAVGLDGREARSGGPGPVE